MGPSGALRAVRALRPDGVIPIHPGIQPRLPLLRASKGVEAFAAALSRSGLNARLVQLREGESYRVPSFLEREDSAGSQFPLRAEAIPEAP